MTHDLKFLGCLSKTRLCPSPIRARVVRPPTVRLAIDIDNFCENFMIFNPKWSTHYLSAGGKIGYYKEGHSGAELLNLITHIRSIEWDSIFIYYKYYYYWSYLALQSLLQSQWRLQVLWFLAGSMANLRIVYIFMVYLGWELDIMNWKNLKIWLTEKYQRWFVID